MVDLILARLILVDLILANWVLAGLILGNLILAGDKWTRLAPIVALE